MINLSYRFDQNSCCLQLAGMPDVSNGDSKDTIGILSSWTLKIIGSPSLEGKKEHLDTLMQVILQYSLLCISGIRKKVNSSKNFVTISPFGAKHKLLLNSTRDGVKPLEIILDDSEFSDLTRCLDLLRYDPRFNLNWNINIDRPFSKRYIKVNLNKTRRNLNIFSAFVVFITTSSLLLLIPINNNEIRKTNNYSHSQSGSIK